MDIQDEDGNNYHPNIKNRQIENKKRALAYCSKEDPNPLCYNMDIHEETKARESHKKILGKRLLDGEPLNKVVEENPELIFEYTKLETNLAAYKRAKRE